MKCIDCKVGYCSYRSTNPQQECALQNTAGTIISKPSEGKKEFIVPEGTAMTIDWNAFRIEAAKDFLPLAVQMCDGRGYPEKCVSHAISLADELIKQLQES